MTLMSLTIRKMNVDRKYVKPGKLEISNNVSIKDVSEITINMGKTKQKAMKINYEYSTKYNPDIATISIEGEAVYAADDKIVKEHIDKWKKDKKVDNPIMKEVLNSVLAKCTMIALQISKEIALPPPIPIPKIK